MIHLVANIAWCSSHWTTPTLEGTNFGYVADGNLPHEGWNFDKRNLRNQVKLDGRNVLYGHIESRRWPPLKYQSENNGQGLIFFVSRNMPRDRKLYIVGIYGFAKVFPHRILQDNEKHTVSIVGDYDFSFPFYPDAYRLFDNQRYLNRLTGIGRANFAYVSKNGAMRILEDVLSAHRGLLVEHTDNKDLESVVEKLNSLYQAIFGNPPPEAHPKQPKHLSKTEKGTQQFEEGFKQEIVAEVTKRSGALVQAVKQRDNFLCQICGFDFGEFYGDYGKGFAECHHLTPVSKLEGQRFVNVDEAITVCANCHRMLHRGENLLSPDELRALIRQAQQKKTWSSWFHRTKKKGE